MAYKIVVHCDTVPVGKPITYPVNAWKTPTFESIASTSEYVTMMWYEMIRVEDERKISGLENILANAGTLHDIRVPGEDD